MQEKTDITYYIKQISYSILTKIIRNYEGAEDQGIKKKQENYVAFPFTISLETSYPQSVWKMKSVGFTKKKPPLLKNNTFSEGRKASSDMEHLFFKPIEEISSPSNFTRSMLHQMEHDIHYSKVFRKEVTAPILEENFTYISTIETKRRTFSVKHILPSGCLRRRS